MNLQFEMKQVTVGQRQAITKILTDHNIGWDIRMISSVDMGADPEWDDDLVWRASDILATLKNTRLGSVKHIVIDKFGEMSQDLGWK